MNMTSTRIHWMSLVALALASCVATNPENLGELETSSSGATDSDTDPTAATASSGMSSTTVEPTTTTPSSTGSESESESETTPGTESESESQTEAGSTEDTGEPIVCEGGEVEHFPAGCPEAASGVQLPAQGCYEECTGLDDACDVGLCMLTQVDPCPCANDPNLCCDSCSGEQWLCVDEAALGACGFVLGRTFTSVEELECGLGPKGPALCNWSVAFAFDGTFMWMHSDVGEGGSYACADGTITISDGPMVEAAYDADADTLTWDGVQYE